jgi:hypothetical protein
MTRCAREMRDCRFHSHGKDRRAQSGRLRKALWGSHRHVNLDGLHEAEDCKTARQ